MPELPEVETTVRVLGRVLKGLSIKDVWSDYYLKTAHGHKPSVKNRKYFGLFRKKILNKKIVSASRRGKNILIELSSGDTILTHMKMTGHYLYGDYSFDKKTREWRAEKEGPLKDPFNRFLRLVFKLSNGKSLALSDVRRFAKVVLIGRGEEDESIKELGPEPLSNKFDFVKFRERINKKSGPIKSILMDQKIIAGIGNIYSDEILWMAGVHPESYSVNIPEKQLLSIFKEIKKILRESIKIGGDSTSDYRKPDGKRGGFQNKHNAYKRKNLKCTKKNCTGTIRRIILRGRSTHFCDKHQRKY